jgi:hypothetical protein
MARKAGFETMITKGKIHGFDRDGDYTEELKAFADLVRADEREQIAQMIEDAPPLMPFAQNDQGGCMMCGFTPKIAAATIRARGNT